MTREWFDLTGYVAGLLMLVSLVWLRLKRATYPESAWESAAWVAPGMVLCLWTCLPDANANRWLAYMGLMLAASLVRLVDVSRWRRLVGFTIYVFAAVVIVDATLNIGRATFINPNTAAAILLLGLTFDQVKKKRYWLLLMGLVATGSRGALLGLLLAGVLMLWRKIPAARKLPAVIVIGGVAATFLALRLGTVWARLDHWQEAARLFMASPIIGWGTSAYMFVSRIPYQVHADSAPLTLLAEHGLAALVFVPLIWLAVKRWPLAPFWTRLGLLSFAFQNLVDDTWLSPWPALLLGANLGILWRLDELRKTALAGADPAASAAGAPADDRLQPVV